MSRFLAEKFAETPTSYPSPEAQELFQAILMLSSVKEAATFFRDLLTMAEIKEFANRWQMVKMLYQKKPYLEIATKLHTSTTTVARVAHWLNHGMGGYKTLVDRLFTTRKLKDYHEPARFTSGRLRGWRKPNEM